MLFFAKIKNSTERIIEKTDALGNVWKSDNRPNVTVHRNDAGAVTSVEIKGPHHPYIYSEAKSGTIVETDDNRYPHETIVHRALNTGNEVFEVENPGANASNTNEKQ